MARLRPILKTRARQLRNGAPDAEQRLWFALRNRQVDGAKFRRQYVIGRYIADFACTERKLIIELDGGQHTQKVRYDDKRTEFLESRGFRVLRFWDNDVLSDTDAVLESIRLALISRPSP
jgi:very-short-patch-repair endonuclease